MLTNYGENKVIDAFYRGQAIGVPATWYIGLVIATKGRSNTRRSQAMTIGDTIIPATPNGRMYRCTTGGTTGAGEPTWPTTNDGTVVDGSVTWTEMFTALQVQATIPEASGGSYARVGITASLANMAGTQGAGTTVASTGTSGQTSNNAAVTFPAPSADWGTIFGYAFYDASSAGNAWTVQEMTTPQDVLNGQAAPSFAIAALTQTVK